MINQTIALSQIQTLIQKYTKCAESAHALGNQSMHSYFRGKVNDLYNAAQGWEA